MASVQSTNDIQKDIERNQATKRKSSTLLEGVQAELKRAKKELATLKAELAQTAKDRLLFKSIAERQHKLLLAATPRDNIPPNFRQMSSSQRLKTKSMISNSTTDNPNPINGKPVTKKATLFGKFVVVRWCDNTDYKGKITNFDENTNKFCCDYDDGDVRWYYIFNKKLDKEGYQYYAYNRENTSDVHWIRIIETKKEKDRLHYANMNQVMEITGIDRNVANTALNAACGNVQRAIEYIFDPSLMQTAIAQNASLQTSPLPIPQPTTQPTTQPTSSSESAANIATADVTNTNTTTIDTKPATLSASTSNVFSKPDSGVSKQSSEPEELCAKTEGALAPSITDQETP
jgi:hypothetical protein